MDAGDTAWLLTSCALVLLMTPGLAFFYGGLVPERAVLNTMKMCFIALGVIALQWSLVGYSLAFSPGSAWLGSLAWAGLDGVGPEPSPEYAPTAPHLSFMAFQMMFAIITPALISGAVVGRMRFKAYAMFIVLWAFLVYDPLAHWVWGSGGWIRELGALDFAGGTVVHISSGISALVAAVVIGPRARPAAAAEHRGGDEPAPAGPHNVPFVLLGAALLWFGWFGFNAGSSLAADGLAALAFVTTMLSSASAVVALVASDIIRGDKPSAVRVAIAAVVGLVAITPAAGFVTPMAALAIGAIAVIISDRAMKLFRRKLTRLDDTLDVFACHGIGGIVGALLTGVFATTRVNPAGADGLLYGNPRLLLLQLLGVAASAALAAAGTAVILHAMKMFMALRPSAEQEVLGIDASEHGEAGYVMDRGDPALLSPLPFETDAPRKTGGDGYVKRATAGVRREADERPQAG